LRILNLRILKLRILLLPKKILFGMISRILGMISRGDPQPFGIYET